MLMAEEKNDLRTGPEVGFRNGFAYHALLLSSACLVILQWPSVPRFLASGPLFCVPSLRKTILLSTCIPLISKFEMNWAQYAKRLFLPPSTSIFTSFPWRICCKTMAPHPNCLPYHLFQKIWHYLNESTTTKSCHLSSRNNQNAAQKPNPRDINHKVELHKVLPSTS